MKIPPQLGDIVLECITDTDDRQRDHNFRNRLATHGLPLPQNRAARAQYSPSIKSAGKRITLGVRSSIMPSYSGIRPLSIIRPLRPQHDGAPIAAFYGAPEIPSIPFRGVIAKYAQNSFGIRLGIVCNACQFFDAGMYEKAA
ncbi:MAG: hypothetical protein ABWY10_09790 [Tardiphaga sp.]